MDIINQVKHSILSPYGMEEKDIDKIMDSMLSATVDDADIYFQASHFESWVLEGGIVKEGSHSIEQGAGVRVVSGEKTGFAYSDRIELSVLLEAAKNVKAIARQGQIAQKKIDKVAGYPSYYDAVNPLKSLADQEKIALLRRVDIETRKLDSRIEEVIVSLVGVHEKVMVANCDGSLVADIRPLTRMNVTVILEENGQREQGSMGGGARSDYGYFLDQDKALQYGVEAVRQAVVNL
ncbi:MAG: DNA gyrase modulator, partial [Methylococcales bacterium]